ncbi:hypothetical protein B566_EDAN002414 [Ephemera danica]|nr:hypothetical protein B566_EDAN002414 [Ephemera danica]
MKLCRVVCAMLLIFVGTAGVETWFGCGRWNLSKCSNANCVKTAKQAIQNVTGMLIAGYYTHVVFYCDVNFTLQGISHFKCDIENDVLQPRGEFPTCRPLNEHFDANNSTAKEMENNSSTNAFNSTSMENSTHALSFTNIFLLSVFIVIFIVILCFILYILQLRRLLRKRDDQLSYFRTRDTANNSRNMTSNDPPDVLQLVPLRPKQHSSAVVYEYPTIENVVHKFDGSKHDRPKLRTPPDEKEEYVYATASSFYCYNSVRQRDSSNSSTKTPIDDVGDTDSLDSQTINVPITSRPRLKTPVEEVENSVAKPLIGGDDEKSFPVKLSLNSYDNLPREVRNEMSQRDHQRTDNKTQDNEFDDSGLVVVNGDYNGICM